MENFDKLKKRKNSILIGNGIFAEIIAERRRQDKQWGGADHDDNHLPSDFMDFIEKQTYKTYTANGDGDFRGRFIKIAALAVAAVESIDRSARSEEN